MAVGSGSSSTDTGYCTPSDCQNNCTSNNCNYNRPSCSSNRAISLSNVAKGHIIKASDLETLRANTINEINRWNQNHTYNFSYIATSKINTGAIIRASDMNNVIHDLSHTGHGSTSNVSAGALITTTKLASNMLGLYNSLRTDCICNSDCGAHTLCGCHGDCGCNYS